MSFPAPHELQFAWIFVLGGLLHHVLFPLRNHKFFIHILPHTQSLSSLSKTLFPCFKEEGVETFYLKRHRTKENIHSFNKYFKGGYFIHSLIYSFIQNIFSEHLVLQIVAGAGTAAMNETKPPPSEFHVPVRGILTINRYII